MKKIERLSAANAGEALASPAVAMTRSVPEASSRTTRSPLVASNHAACSVAACRSGVLGPGAASTCWAAVHSAFCGGRIHTTCVPAGLTATPTPWSSAAGAGAAAPSGTRTIRVMGAVAGPVSKMARRPSADRRGTRPSFAMVTDG